MIVFSVYMSFLISRVPPAHSFFQKVSILENTSKSLPTYFLTLTKKLLESIPSKSRMNEIQSVSPKVAIICQFLGLVLKSNAETPSLSSPHVLTSAAGDVGRGVLEMWCAAHPATRHTCTAASSRGLQILHALPVRLVHRLVHELCLREIYPVQINAPYRAVKH